MVLAPRRAARSLRLRSAVTTTIWRVVARVSQSMMMLSSAVRPGSGEADGCCAGLGAAAVRDSCRGGVLDAVPYDGDVDVGAGCEGVHASLDSAAGDFDVVAGVFP